MSSWSIQIRLNHLVVYDYCLDDLQLYNSLFAVCTLVLYWDELENSITPKVIRIKFILSLCGFHSGLTHSCWNLFQPNVKRLVNQSHSGCERKPDEAIFQTTSWGYKTEENSKRQMAYRYRTAVDLKSWVQLTWDWVVSQSQSIIWDKVTHLTFVRIGARSSHRFHIHHRLSDYDDPHLWEERYRYYR